MTGDTHKKKLIHRLRNGNVFAFNEIYTRYTKKIYSISLSFLKDKEYAENVVQDVFLTIWRKRADLKDRYDFDAYLFNITYNTIRKYFRKFSRERKYTEEYVKTISTDDDSTSEEIEYKNLQELAETAISRLPDRQKTVYHLKMVEELTIVEISTKLGISRRTVENHLHRARTYLKKALSDNRLITLLFVWFYIL